MNISEHFRNLTQKVEQHPLVKKVHVKNRQVSLKKDVIVETALSDKARIKKILKELT